MTKIVINCEHGGFGLSEQAQLRYRELAGIPLSEFRWQLDRSDPHLVHVVEELGAQANGPYAQLKVVEIPDGVIWQIDEYDGCEWVCEAYRTWR